MCLSIVSENKPASKGVGYKVFTVSVWGLASFVYSGKYLPRNKWLMSCDGKSGDGPENVGWHIYKRRKDAEAFKKRAFHDSPLKVFRVKYRGAHHQGFGDGVWNLAAAVVVAKEMLIERGK